MSIQNLDSYIYAFFSNIEDPSIGPTAPALLAEVCNIPLEALLSQGGWSVPSYIIRPNNKFQVTQIKRCSYYDGSFFPVERICIIASGILFVLPGVLISSALKIASFICNSHYRHHLSMVANYIIENKQNSLTTEESPLPLPFKDKNGKDLEISSDVLTSCLIPFLTLKDLCQIEKVNKAWQKAVKPLWKSMAEHYQLVPTGNRTKYKQLIKKRYHAIDYYFNKCDIDAVKIFGGYHRLMMLPAIDLPSDESFIAKNSPTKRHINNITFDEGCIDEKYNIFADFECGTIYFRCINENNKPFMFSMSSNINAHMALKFECRTFSFQTTPLTLTNLLNGNAIETFRDPKKIKLKPKTSNPVNSLTVD